MKRLFHTRIRLAGVISLIALAGFLQTATGRGCRVYCNSEFHRYFEGLGTAETRVNPVERVVFSLLLSTTKPEPQAPAKHL